MDDKSAIGQDLHYHHHIDVRGVVLPTWVAILLAIIGFSSSVVVLLAVLVFQSASNQLTKSQENLTKEIRVLQLNVQDIENLLIREKIAKRSDFVKGE